MLAVITDQPITNTSSSWLREVATMEHDEPYEDSEDSSDGMDTPPLRDLPPAPPRHESSALAAFRQAFAAVDEDHHDRPLAGWPAVGEVTIRMTVPQAW